MAVNDPLGDMLTRIRNAQMRRRGKVSTPGSSLRSKVLDVLQSEGFIRGYAVDRFRQRTYRVRDRAQILRQPAGHPQDRARFEARPSRLCGGRQDAARRQRPRRFDPVDPQGRHGRPCRSRGACRRRSALHRVLTVTNGKLSPCHVSARSPWPSPPASPPGWKANRSPSKARRANSSSPSPTRSR